ncbi:hypothetical protein EYF80_022257 [Liparis tanakae]|uniref:Uncharacterized protein n=1 Tax=Liparis tanakae TaxID=230148 RepID=A0A4Z2HRF9_9TELE|nr:hypothetical protein EYF80_022257 [Liparis tanakae]
MKQLQALTDGPRCKHAAAAVTETGRQTDGEAEPRTQALSLTLLQQHSGVSSHRIHLKQSI